MSFREKFFRALTAIILCIINLFNINTGEVKQTTDEVNGSLVCTDALGRSVTSTGSESEKLVGVFYFLWMGQHSDCSPAIFDNTKILAANPDAIKSEQSWFAAGGGDVGDFHYWSEPLFGYYRSDDEWVIRKHAQMLTDAGVDFIFFDTTNPGLYLNVVEKIIDVWHEYYLEGWDVPKMLFYTNTNSGRNINTIHDDLYNNAELYAKYPKLDELWFYMDGKPLIIGNKDDAALRDDVKDYFRIKSTQWPYDAKEDDGFPWMEFSERLLSIDSVYKYNGVSIMNVSAAQHCNTGRFSATAWYGSNDRTRSWHDGANDTSDDADLYGYNFAEQWEFALKMDTDIVTVTGFNEWVAQRQTTTEETPVFFVDNATENCSRDVEPAKGRLGDNYYLQMVDYITKYKGNVATVSRASGVSIDIGGSFSQWDNEKITAKYRDYKNDTADRNCHDSANDFLYTDTSGRNDIVNMKVTDDSENYYFYVETAESLTPSTDKNWMSLFINESYVVNRTSPENGITAVEKITDSGYEKVGEAQIKFEGNKLMLKLPKALVEDSEALNFKWADNYVENDVYSFYTNGDSAPYGRMYYVY